MSLHGNAGACGSMLAAETDRRHESVELSGSGTNSGKSCGPKADDPPGANRLACSAGAMQVR